MFVENNGYQAAAELYESIDAAREAVNCYIAGEAAGGATGRERWLATKKKKIPWIFFCGKK